LGGDEVYAKSSILRDPKAFVIIGEGRQALGEGFMPWEKNLRNSV